MRAMGIAAAGLMIGLGLTSCDMPASAPPQQQARAPAPAAPCNCQQPSFPGEHLARLDDVPHRHHMRRTAYRAYGERYHGSYLSQSQSSVQTYGYVSASSVSYRSSETSDGGYESDARYGYESGHHHYYRGQISWVDGYGRGYFQTGSATVAQTMTGRRLAPYRGYDVDCPEDRR